MIATFPTGWMWLTSGRLRQTLIEGSASYGDAHASPAARLAGDAVDAIGKPGDFQRKTRITFLAQASLKVRFRRADAVKRTPLPAQDARGSQDE